MKEILISQIAPIFTTAVVTALVILIKQVSSPLLDLVVTKKAEVDQRIAASGHEADLNNAIEVWRIVDEKFRITENAYDIFVSKEKLFETILLERIPGLSQKNIDDLRDTVAGIFNHGREALFHNTRPSQAICLDTSKISEKDLSTLTESITKTIDNLSSINALKPVSDNTVEESDTKNV